MLVYFIEREDGMWMAHPNEMGESWTRNPLKAWAFDATIGAIDAEVGINIRFSFDANRLANTLFHGMGYRVTEHEFIEGTKTFEYIEKESVILYGGNSYLYLKNCSIAPGVSFILNNECVKNCTIADCNGSTITFVNNPLFDDQPHK